MRSGRTSARLLVAFAVVSCSKQENAAPAPSSTPAPTGSSAPASAPIDAKVETPPADPDAAYRWYRVEARIDERTTVPFFIGVHPELPEGVVYSGGEERLPLVMLSREPLRLRIPVRGAELVLQPDGGDGRLTGTWLVEYFHKRNYDVVAMPVMGPRLELLFPGSEAPTVDLSGEWRFDIKSFGVGRGTFQQASDGSLHGTLIPPEVGDLRHLAGRVTGDRAQLSVYDGMHGFYVGMHATDGGTRLAGELVIAAVGRFTFTATREQAPETHLTVSAHMAPGKTRISLPDLEKPPYAGNPVIVDYFGSWCPVCLDLTPELVRLYKQHNAAGLQVYSIALEPTGDETEAQRRLDEFRAAFGMTWPFHTMFTDDFNGHLPKELKATTGFPVTIFLRRDHTVAAIHTGFVSKAAGAEHTAVVKKLDGYAADIVASPPAKP